MPAAFVDPRPVGCYHAAMKRGEKAVAAYRRAASGGAPSEARAAAADAGRTRTAAGVENGGKVAGLLKGEGSGARRAAKFLLLLSKDDAAGVLKQLAPAEIEKVAVEIARIRKIDVGEARAILEDFGKLHVRGGTRRGGPDVAKEMLERAFGREKGDALFYRAVPTGRLNPFDFLDELEFDQILMVLRHEPASVLSVVFPYMQPDKAAKVLEALHPDLQRETIHRVGRLEAVDPAVLSRIAEALRERIRRQGKIVTEEVDGRAALAEILRYISAETESDILRNLEQYDAELSNDIQERMLTIEVVFSLRDSDLQAILRDFSDTELAVVLKGKDDRVRERILSNLSERRATLAREEMERLGPMKRREVADATKEFLLYIRDLEEEGRLVIDLDDEYLVD